MSPKADAAPAAGAAPNTTQAQSPKCAVPPLNANRQVMQPNPAQVNWAVQMAEQGLLTGSAYTRPTGFGNMGLVADAPNSDFPLIPLSHPAGGTNTVPRSIFEGNADPRYLENWYFAAWAYNSGIQPNAANGNTTGCTPGPSCTSAHGTAEILTQDKSGLPTRSSGPMLVTVIFICTGERYPSPAWLLS